LCSHHGHRRLENTSGRAVSGKLLERQELHCRVGKLTLKTAGAQRRDGRAFFAGGAV